MPRAYTKRQPEMPRNTMLSFRTTPAYAEAFKTAAADAGLSRGRWLETAAIEALKAASATSG